MKPICFFLETKVEQTLYNPHKHWACTIKSASRFPGSLPPRRRSFWSARVCHRLWIWFLDPNEVLENLRSGKEKKIPKDQLPFTKPAGERVNNNDRDFIKSNAFPVRNATKVLQNHWRFDPKLLQQILLLSLTKPTGTEHKKKGPRLNKEPGLFAISHLNENAKKTPVFFDIFHCQGRGRVLFSC